ncbi:Flp family type IVb pilin [Oceanicaulis sp. MMSF_3324]|uniref:Flp family type IVb pilin n=1 Tax=Oceanicaulis sp. MMSF_3324 TaxID=3046702 RepID=UPI00273FB801|nr:Flp family type IVb pilin [Oceanicaulis sp. MMSF_3324]
MDASRSVPRLPHAARRQTAGGRVARQAGRCARRLIADESGATAIEYGLLVGLLGVVVITAVSLLGNQLWALLQSVSTTISTASGGGGG